MILSVALLSRVPKVNRTGKEIHVHFETTIFQVSRKHKYLRLKPIFKMTAPLEIYLLEFRVRLHD